MYFIRKLKPPGWSPEYTVGIIMIPMFIITAVLGGIKTMFGFIAVVEFIVMLIQLSIYLKTRNIGFLWMALAFLFITVFAVQVAINGLDNKSKGFMVYGILVLMASLIIVLIVMSKKVKWRTREVLELAAMPVNHIDNGFTERPLPSGKIDASDFEIKAFAEFVRQKLIAIPYFEEEKVVFSLTSKYLKQAGFKGGYSDESWIAFDKSGNVSVFISKEDYLKYKDAFSFDQLCASLGNLFIGFFDLFKNGEGVRIIDRFNALRLNPLIE